MYLTSRHFAASYLYRLDLVFKREAGISTEGSAIALPSIESILIMVMLNNFVALR